MGISRGILQVILVSSFTQREGQLTLEPMPYQGSAVGNSATQTISLSLVCLLETTFAQVGALARILGVLTGDRSFQWPHPWVILAVGYDG